MPNNCLVPRSIITAAAAITRKRKCRLDLTIVRNMGQDLLTQSLPNSELSAVQLRSSDDHHPGAGGWTLRQHSQVAIDGIDADARSNEGQGVRVRVDPGFAARVIEHRSVGNNLPRLPLHPCVLKRGRLDAEPFGRLRCEY